MSWVGLWGFMRRPGSGKVPRALVIAATTGLVIALSVSSPVVAKPVTVWVDPIGDAELRGHPIPDADRLGLLDLVSGSITRQGPVLVFTVKHSAMPDFGALPEAARFFWYFVVDEDSHANHYFVTAKRLEISSEDHPSRVYLDGFFTLEKDKNEHCGGGLLVTSPLRRACIMAYLSGTFDPSKRSMSISVPLSAIGARPGSLIWAGQPESHLTREGGERVCTICWVAHAEDVAWRRVAEANIKIDYAIMTEAYRVPKR